jgi:methionine synthase I (cobalamin-dependent)
MPDFRALLDDGRPHLFDGAMGTMLYARGVYINRCYDELCIGQPDLVRDVHRAYVRPAPRSWKPTATAPTA